MDNGVAVVRALAAAKAGVARLMRPVGLELVLMVVRVSAAIVSWWRKRPSANRT